jgi:hypothetical protein
MGTLPDEPLQLLLFSASMIAHFGRTKKVYPHVFQTPNLPDLGVRLFLLLNISFSPAYYIFLEITFVLFTAILQAIGKNASELY